MSFFRKIFVDSPVWDGSNFYKEYANTSGRINKNISGLPKYLSHYEREDTVIKENYLASLLLGRNHNSDYPECGDKALAFALENLQLTYDIHQLCVYYVEQFPPCGENDREHIVPLAERLKWLTEEMRKAADKIEKNSDKLLSSYISQ
ncbi:MAG: hypothetical protein KGO21_00200 [Hyphomicrobiales bacterium]|nr:hypothetical protein [Hyphomicrobiales bacterium]